MQIQQRVLIRYCDAREMLRESALDDLPIVSIARQAAVSPYHFIRQFSAIFGETPHQFRIRARLETAKLMLAKGEGSVTEICMAVGFSSLGNFSALFMRRFGESPSSYRRRWFALGASPGVLPAAFAPDCMSLMVAAWRAQAQFSVSHLPVPVSR